MTIKFDATAANQYLSMVDSAGLTFPATDFCLSWVMSFDSQTPVQTQYLISNGPYQTAGSINVGHLTGGANFMVVYGQSDLGTSSTAYSTGIRLFVLQRTVVGGVSQMTMRSSPILASSPSTAASVVVDMAPFNFGGTTFDGSGGIVIGGRSDLNAQRFCNQSLGRVFRYDGQLTDLEVAKLAYGMEITDLGHTPAWYVKMETATDITDRGSLANTVTPHGSFVTGTAPAFGYSGGTPAPTPAIDVTQLPAERIYQRIGTSSLIPLAGTYTNTVPTSIEYQLYAADGVTVLAPWATIAGATISGGNWSGTPSISQGGMYRLCVRSKSGSAVLATSNIKANLFGVGDLISCTGSSSANRWFLSNSGSGFTPAANVRRYQSGAWALMSTDGCATAMANSFASQAGVPIGMIGYGVEGETLANWNNISGSSWTAFAAAIAAVGGKIALGINAAGSNDAANGIVVSRAGHAASIRQFISNLRALTGQPSLAFGISGFNRRPGVSDTQADYVRMAENDVGDDAYVYHVQIIDLELSSDLIHLTPAGFTLSGARMSSVFGAVLNGGAYRRGPKLTSLTYSGAVVNAVLAHRNGTDFTPTTGITGFTIADANGTPNITSVARTSPTQIAITCDRVLANPVVKYLYGASPVSNTTTAPANEVFDNGSMPLPMHVETSLVANAASALATTLTFTVVKDINGTIADNATGLDYSIYEATRLNANVLPIKYGSLAITNGSVTVDITGVTTLSPGGTVRINYGPSDGSKVASALVTVS